MLVFTVALPRAFGLVGPLLRGVLTVPRAAHELIRISLL